MIVTSEFMFVVFVVVWIVSMVHMYQRGSTVGFHRGASVAVRSVLGTLENLGIMKDEDYRIVLKSMKDDKSTK